MSESQSQFLDEISEQPQVIAQVLKRLAKHSGDIPEFVHAQTSQLIFVAEGSSLNVLNLVKPWLEASWGKPIRVFTSTECQTYLGLCEINVNASILKQLKKQTTWVFLSQSGNTGSLLSLLKTIQQFLGVSSKKINSILITNGTDSQLEALCQNTYHLGAGPETSIPATKTVSASIMSLLLLASRQSAKKAEFKKVPKTMSSWLDSADVAHQVKQLARRAMGYRQILLISDGLTSLLLPEVALKLTEIVGIPVHTSEMERFQHGYKMLLKNSMPSELLVIYVVSPKSDGKAYYTQLEKHWVDGSGKVWNPLGQIHLICPENAPKMPAGLAKNLGIKARCVTMLPDVQTGYPGLFTLLLFFQWMAYSWAKEAHLSPNASPLSKYVGQ